MTKQEIQAYIDAEANVAADKHNADWAKTQPTFYNSETLVRRLHFLPGYKAGFEAGFDTGAELERKRAQVLVEALEKVQNYLHWNTDNLCGDDLIGDGRLTANFNNRIIHINEALQAWNEIK